MLKPEVLAVLPPDVVAQVQAEINLATEQGRIEGAASSRWKPWFRGMALSLTAYFAVIIAAWPILEPKLRAPLVPAPVPENAWHVVVSLIGAVVLLAIRSHTSESLEAKGQ